MNNRMRVGVACALVSMTVAAADKVWTGGGSDANWTSAANWGGSAPVAGDSLFFGGSVKLTNTNNFTAGTSFSNLIFATDAGAFVLNGNQITLDGGLSNLSTTAKIVNAPLLLNGIRTIFGSNALFTVNGVLSGPGGLNTCVTNTLTLSGNNTYEGFTTVSNSTLLITHASALGSTNAGTRVFSNSDGTLRLSGGIEINEPLYFSGNKPNPVQYTASLISDVGTNTIRSLITKEGTLRIRTISGTGKVLVLSGGILNIGGSNLGFNPESGSTIIVKDKPLQLGSVSIQSEYPGTVVLAVSGNVYGSLLLVDNHKVRTDVADALCPTATLTVGGSWVAGGILDMNGFDQTTTLLKTDNFSNPGYRAVTSAVPATLTVNQNSSSVYAAALAGAVNLVKNGTGALIFSNVMSTTTGDISVNGGTLAVAESGGFGNITRMRVNGGTLELRNSAALADTATVLVAAGAKIKLALAVGVSETVKTLYLDGVPQVSGTWGSSTSGAAHINDTYFTGDGMLNVTAGPTQSTDARWDGGGVNSNMTTAANWLGDIVPDAEGYSTATFSDSGSTAVVDAPFTFNRMVFSADNNFTLAAGAGVITNGFFGLQAKVPNTTSRTYTIASALVLREAQTWAVTNNGSGVTTVNVTGALSDDGQPRDVTLCGNGFIQLAGNNTFTGKTTIKTNTCVVVKHGNALGSTAGSTWIENGGYIRIDGGAGSGVTVNETVIMTGDESLAWAGTIRSASGTNTWTGKITANNARLRCETGAGFEIKGGVDGSSLICTAVGNTAIRFSEKPITAGNLTSHTSDGGIIFAVPGSTFPTFTACGPLLRTDVPNAFSPALSLTQGDGSHGISILNLNGNDQTVGAWRTGSGNSEPRMLYSVAPATFTVNQNSDTLFNGVITGAVSIVKLGTGTLTLTNAFISTSGSFIVSNGTLNVANQGTFGPNSTNIVVGGTGTLVISNSLAIADVATIQMPTNSVSTAKINLAEGVDERVGWLYFGGKMQNAGTYGSNDSPATYKDNTHFAGKGVLTVRFDEFGTVLIVR